MTNGLDTELHVDLTKITRFELIDLGSHAIDARVWIGGPPYDKAGTEVRASIQDDGRTLKIFVKRKRNK